MIKKIVDNIDANIYLAAAEQLGYEYRVLDYEDSLISISNNSKNLLIYKNRLSLNNIVQRYIASDKALSSRLLAKRFKEYIPRQLIIDFEHDDFLEQAFKHSKEKNYKVVVKPLNLSSGDGVKILPKNDQEVADALLTIKENFAAEKAIIEDYLSGNHEYRVVVLFGEVFDVLERFSARVVGNGKDSILELVQKINKFREKHELDPIKIDEEVIQLLKEQNLTVDTVVSKHKTIKLKKACNFSQGGSVQRIQLNLINSSYLQFFEKIAKEVNIPFLGIDVISSDITASWKPNELGINELNSAPMIELHYYADLMEKKEQPESAKKLLKKILE